MIGTLKGKKVATGFASVANIKHSEDRVFNVRQSRRISSKATGVIIDSGVALCNTAVK